MTRLSLQGLWQANLEDRTECNPPRAFPDRIQLPGTTSLAGLGPANPVREDGCLTETHPFAGRAWYQRTFSCPGDGPALLTLERTRISGIWLDGAHAGRQDSLCTPHRYYIPRLTRGEHTLTLLVDNASLPIAGGHMTAKDTQTNWNGVTGELSIAFGRVFPVHVLVTMTEDGASLRFQCDLLGQPVPGEPFDVAIDGQKPASFRLGEASRIDCLLPLSEPPAPWDPERPALHRWTLRLGEDTFEGAFGLRTLSAEGRQIKINGKPVFLRGKHDALVFPRTGFAPTDEDTWTSYLKTLKEYGLNHVRFHTCCPPEAAFIAADHLGMLLEPELPFWGSLHAPGEEGYDERADRYLFQEGWRILREFGGHPSFFLFSLGNELWGSRDHMSQWLRAYRAEHPHLLYTAGSNNFQFQPAPLPEEDVFVGVRLSLKRLFRGSYAMCDAPQGIVQTTAPESVSDYDQIIDGGTGPEEATGSEIQIQYGTEVKTVSLDGTAAGHERKLPLVSHEIGQYSFYPDFAEEAKYTGPLRPLYLDTWRERLSRNGLYADWPRFFRAAGKLACDCYRREIETALRTSSLSGFQLLDLQDYPGQGVALVGVLDAMMDSKGLISPEEWRSFCGETVLLARLDRFVFPGGTRLRFGLQVSECRPEVLRHRITWRLLGPEGPCCQGTLETKRTPSNRLTDLEWVLTPPVEVRVSGRYALEARTAEGHVQTWPLWFLSGLPVQITRDGIRTGEGFIPFLREGEKAPAAGPFLRCPDPKGKLPAEYASDFWCYRMFRDISRGMGKPEPVGTLGLCIDPADPLLSLFPTETYTTPLWYGPLRVAHCEPIQCPSPAVQMIDTPERARRLGILYRQDGEVCLTARLWEAPDDPAVKCLARSLVHGLLSAGR